MPKLFVSCENCEALFSVWPSRLKQGAFKNCSVKCCNELRNKKTKQTNLERLTEYLDFFELSILNKHGSEVGKTRFDKDDLLKIIDFGWVMSTYGYAVAHKKIMGKNKTYSMHRVVLDSIGKLEIDHINMNRLDNRKANLRFVTDSQQRWNTKSHLDSRSKFKGVNFLKSSGKWQARIAVNNKRYFLGNFRSEVEAAKAYDLFSKRYHGEFARLNFE